MTRSAGYVSIYDWLRVQRPRVLRQRTGAVRSGGGAVYVFQCEATFDAEPAAVWKVWTDVSRWPDWDLTKEIARIDGPFEPGISGWAKQRGNLGGTFTITAIESGRRWASECPLPLGKVIFEHVIEPAEAGRVRVTKSVQVFGGFGPLFRLMFAARMRRDITESLEALGRRVHD